MHVPHLLEIEMVQGAMAELGKEHGKGAKWGETKEKKKRGCTFLFRRKLGGGEVGEAVKTVTA
jgi:hypothetical protein